MTQRSAHHGIRRIGIRRTFTAWAAAVALALTGASLAAAIPVPASHNFYEETSWAAAHGITGGYSDGTFRPSKTTTRGGMAAFMERLNNYVGNRC